VTGEGADSVNPIEALKAEKPGLALLDEFPRLMATPTAELSKDDQVRIKWLGFWWRDTEPPTLMQRIRIPGGVATSAQLRAIALIAQEYGRDLVDVTTRQQVQLRWLETHQIKDVYERLWAVGLTSLQNGMDSIRNVVTSSVARLDADELIDALPICREVSDWITNFEKGNPEVANLPRKLNIHITGHTHDLGSSTNDIGMYPARKNGTVGFNVAVGGAVGGKHPMLARELNVWIEPHDALEITRGIVELYNQHGPREERHKARLKWLLEDWGVARFRAELETHLGRTLETAGEDLRVHGTPRLHLGVNAQKQPGLHYIGAHVPVGRTTGTALLELAELADQYGTGEARFTIEQNILLPNIKTADLETVLAHPLFQRHTPFPNKIVEGVVSCTGVEFCPMAVIETKTRALEVSKELETTLLHELPLAEPIRIHWSGCQHACSSHHIGDFGLQGTKVKVEGVMVEAVDIYAGGMIGRDARLATKILERVPIADVPRKLIELTREKLPHLLEKQVVLEAADD
jgi:ferredoxin-nitrite reductase